MDSSKKSESREDDFMNDDEEVGVLSYVKSFFAVTFSTFIGFWFLAFLFFNRNCYWFQRNVLFLHFARWPLVRDFDKPEKCDLKGVRNFYLQSSDNVKLGIWHVLPASSLEDTSADEVFDKALSSGKPIILYAHGNSGSRATYHRVELYKLLQELDYHVISFDYRSYGDSTAIAPDEIGVIDDTVTVIKWALSKKGNSPMFVWGHSLGTGIISKSATQLEKEGADIKGIILESPFNNISDAIKNHPTAYAIRNMIGFDYFMVDPVVKNGISFKSDEYLAGSKLPLLILHAQDDWILPVRLGRMLYRYLLKNRTDAKKVVRYVEFSKKGGYGHKYICYAKALPDILNSFINGAYDEIPSSSD